MQPVALVGLPGSGKSTVGRLLAQRLAFPFVDTDTIVEARAGCTIAQLFEEMGEPAFRDLEQSVIHDTCNHGPAVIATGGGAVIRPANRDELLKSTRVVYLKSDPIDLLRRLRGDMQRPLLQVADPLSRLRQLHDERDSMYASIASLVVEAGGRSARSVCDDIVAWLHASSAPIRTAPP